MLSARAQAQLPDQQMSVQCAKCGRPATLTIERREQSAVTAWTCPYTTCNALQYQRCDGALIGVRRGRG
jgi:hypothetical protein